MTRRTVAFLVSVAMLASLSVVTLAAPAGAATPKCDGKVATIVSSRKVIRGTPRADVIVAKGKVNNRIFGYGGRDRICAGKGNDRVDGGKGADRIFGGSGHDHLEGNRGNDGLFGFRGDDTLEGGPNNDFLNGGVGSDKCEQGPGSGPERDCEVADLSITVTTPANVDTDPDQILAIPVQVRVSNAGPDTVRYWVEVSEDDQGLSDCADESWGRRKFGPIANGEEQTLEYWAYCLDSYGPGGWMETTAVVEAQAVDPNPGNNVDDSYTDIVEP